MRGGCTAENASSLACVIQLAEHHTAGRICPVRLDYVLRNRNRRQPWAVRSGRSVAAAEPQHTQSIPGPRSAFGPPGALPAVGPADHRGHSWRAYGQIRRDRAAGQSTESFRRVTIRRS